MKTLDSAEFWGRSGLGLDQDLNFAESHLYFCLEVSEHLKGISLQKLNTEAL